MRQSTDLPGATELHNLLTSIRQEFCIPAHVLEALNERAIGATNMPKSVADLKNPAFIVPRHTLINIINEQLIPEMAKQAGKRLIKFYADISGIDSAGNEYILPLSLLQAARERPRTAKEYILPHYLIYEGQELCFVHGNINLDLDWVTNSSCTLRTLVFDAREPDDPGTGDYWELKYTPLSLIVETESSTGKQVVADLPLGCFSVPINTESGMLKIPAHLRGPPGSTTQMYIRRRGFHVIPVAAATSYFFQGNTVPPPHEVVIDLRIPLVGGIHPAVPYVSASRPKSLDQLYLLHPLWTNEAEKAGYLHQAAKVYTYDADTKAIMEYLEIQTAETKKIYPDSQLHYTTASDPWRCATCQQDLRRL